MTPPFIVRYSPSTPSQTGQEFVLPLSKSLLARTVVLSTLLSKPYTLPADEALPQDIWSLHHALIAWKHRAPQISVEESGTAMRLMLALLAYTTSHSVRLEGTGRQHRRPIGALVEALRCLGARIEYLETEGYPPLLVHPSTMQARAIELDASESSQYLTALLLLAPHLGKGYQIKVCALSSEPYIAMTLGVLRWAGIHIVHQGDTYRFDSTKEVTESIPIERDWSSASYIYELMALHPEIEHFDLPGLYRPPSMAESTTLASTQGDAHYLTQIFRDLGIKTEFTGDGIRLIRQPLSPQTLWRYNMSACPDLVPALVGTLLGLGIAFEIEGIAHLRLKESDRLDALSIEAHKLGYLVQTSHTSLCWSGDYTAPQESTTIDPHGDHRIAMALLPLAKRHPQHELQITSPSVVSKSFPTYYTLLTQLGYKCIQ